MLPLFDGFELDPQGFRLLRHGVEVNVERRPLELLCYLAAHPQRLIRKRELREKVWQAQSLSEGVLANTVAKLRRTLGQAADARAPLETVRGVGYRWHAPVQGPSSVPEARSRNAAEPRLVARSLPRLQLSAALDAAAHGGGQLWVIDGEAGIGKTALLRDLEHEAKLRGFSVWRGAGYDGGSAPAYWPWVEILRAAHEQLSPPEWQRHLPEPCAALAGLIPELCGGDATLPPTAALRFKLFDELTRFLKAASTDAPRVIVLDDVHWADVATLELAGYAARALERSAVLVAVAARDHDAAWDDAKLAALRSLQRQGKSISLQGLSTSEVAELLGVFAVECNADAALTRALTQRTQGNPLFIRQLVEWLKQRGALSAAGLLQLTQAELPPVVRGVIEQRLAVLPRATMRALSAAAVIGSEFDAHTLAELIETPLAEVLSALDAAAHQNIIERSDLAAARRFAFTHSLVRDALYASLGSADRGALHAKLVQLWVARAADSDARQLASIAHHSLLAVPSAITASVQHSLRAAAAARASTGFEAAADILLQLMHKHERESDELRERCELLLWLGIDQKCAGQDRAAYATFKRGAELSRQLSDADLLARFAYELAAWLEFGGADEDFVWSMLEQAQRCAAQASLATQAIVLAQRAQLEVEQPLQVREAWLAEAESLAAREGSGVLERQVTYARAVMRTLSRLEDSERALERYRVLDRQSRPEAIDAARTIERFSAERVAYTHALLACQSERAEAALARCRELARSAHVAGIDFVVELMNAGRALATGALEELVASAQRLREAASGGGGFELAWLRYMAFAAYEKGALKSVTLSVAMPELRELPRTARVPGEMFQAWVFAAGDNTSDALSVLARLDARYVARMPLCREDLGPLCLLAQTYCQLGERGASERVYAQLEPFAELNAVGPTHEYLGSVAHYLGQVAALLGRQSLAQAHFERAEVVNRSLNMPLQLARTQSERARSARTR